MKVFKYITLGFAALGLSTSVQAADNPTIMMRTTKGPVTIELRPDLAPKHVDRILELVKDEFYDGIVFHRVIDGFMAQTGDPTGTGTGGSGENIPAEFTTKASFGRGTVGMARSMNPDSADSQFFICFKDCSFLDGKYTIIGQVTKGMESVDAIKRGEPPVDPDKIVTITVVE